MKKIANIWQWFKQGNRLLLSEVTLLHNFLSMQLLLYRISITKITIISTISYTLDLL